jgi:aspartate-semialdehyde dehydrogenase
MNLPLAPKQFIRYFEEENRPQTKLDRDLEKGMAVSVGRLRADSQYDYKFVLLIAQHLAWVLQEALF